MRESRTSGISVRGRGSNPPVYSTRENSVNFIKFGVRARKGIVKNICGQCNELLIASMLRHCLMPLSPSVIVMFSSLVSWMVNSGRSPPNSLFLISCISVFCLESAKLLKKVVTNEQLSKINAEGP